MSDKSNRANTMDDLPDAVGVRLAGEDCVYVSCRKQPVLATI